MSQMHNDHESCLSFQEGISSALTSEEIGKEYTIEEFLNEFSVCIPMLQRDYAQGRKDKGYIRKKFLNEIKDTLGSTSTHCLTLDFIYGYQNLQHVFSPLDGQQRLTTVWLAYWYLAYKAKKLTEERQSLLKFSYETRKSSREFCEALCSKDINFTNEKGIINYIQQQTWFFAEWKKDPTISSMLRTLGGKNDDGIEQIFVDLATNANKWASLLEKFKQSIKFNVLIIGDKQLPSNVAEHLYVKMNSRGKSLTDFENFKADFIAHLTNKDCFKDKQLNEKKIETEIASKIDNDWNDIFWSSVKAGDTDGQTDEVFFAFINRYCFNLLCLKSGTSFLKLIKKIDNFLGENDNKGKIEKETKIDANDEEKDDLIKYKYFVNDEQISYEEFDKYYEKILDYDTVISLYNMFKNLKDNIDSVETELSNINTVVSHRENSKYHFIPYYKIKERKKELKQDKGGNNVGIVTETTYKERLYFFAICEYLSNVDSFDHSAFSNWIRFSRNIIENYGIDSINAMILCMKELNSFKDNVKNIFEHLKMLPIPLFDKPTKCELQKKEEILKAKQLGTLNENLIREAEDYSIFCGQIRILYTDDNGNENWTDFATKFSKAKSIFDSNNGSVVLDYVKQYARSFADFNSTQDKMIFHQKGWQNRGDNWLDVLEKDYTRSHKLLTGSMTDVSSGEYKSFLESRTFEAVVKKWNPITGESDLRIAMYHDKWALYKKGVHNGKLYFDDNSFKRNQKIKELCENSSISSFEIDAKSNFNLSECYYWGDDIEFTYNRKSYLWTGYDEIFEIQLNKKKTLKCSSASQKNCTELINLL